MPIIGLTDRGASFPQLGILRKGAPKPERGPGRDLKHFRFDTDDTDAAGRFRTVYGDEPTSVRCYLPFPAVAENFEAWQEHWTAGALQHRCDGQTCALWLDPRTQRYSQTPVPCPHLNVAAGERDRCKPAGRLKVIIPELRRMAYVTVLTGSIHDIIALTEQLTALAQLRGDLRGIPMILRRTPREISMPGANGKRTRVEKWLLSIEAAPTWVDLQLAAQEQQALPMTPRLLPAPPADALTGEVLDDDEPAAQSPAPEPDPQADDDGRRDLHGAVSNVEAAYTKSGKLTLRFTLAHHQVMLLDAAPTLVHLEDGDDVHVTGQLKTYKGADVVQAETLTPLGEEAPWDVRAEAAEPALNPAA